MQTKPELENMQGISEQGDDLIKKLKKDIKIKATPIPEEDIDKLFFQKLPLINRMAKMLDKTGLGAAKATYYFKQSSSSLKAAQNLQITGAVIAGIDFFTIPLAFLAYKLSGKPFPYSFSKGVKFVYSMVVVALAVTAFFVSPAIAAFLSLATVTLGFGSATINLIRHGWSKWRLSKELTQCTKEIEKLTKELKEFKTEEVPKKLEELSKIEQNEPLTYAVQISELCLRQKLLVEQLQKKLDQQEKIKHRQKKVGTRQSIDKTTGFGLSCAALAGIICFIVVPPIGMMILAGTIATSITYVVGRGIYEVVKPVKKSQDTSAIRIGYPRVGHPVETDRNDSTLLTAKLMSGSDSQSKQSLEKLCQKDHALNQISTEAESFIDKIVSENDEKLALEFLCKVGHALEQADYKPAAIKDFVTGLPQFQQALPIFELALKNLAAGAHSSFSQKKLLHLKRIPQVDTYLKQQRMETHSDSLNLEQLFQLPPHDLPSYSAA